MAGLGDMLGSIVKQVIGAAEEQLRAQAGQAAPADTAPYGMGDKRSPTGETVETLLPSAAGIYRRTRVNDRFGGARSGGIFGGYDVDGVEVRVLASLCASPAAARERVRSARDGGEELGGFPVTGASVGTEPSWVTVPGAIVWSRGAYCFSASAYGTEGDVPIPATPEEIAALGRFMLVFPF